MNQTSLKKNKGIKKMLKEYKRKISDIKSECNKVLLVFLWYTYVFKEYIKDLLSCVTFAVKYVHILVFHLAFYQTLNHGGPYWRKKIK